MDSLFITGLIWSLAACSGLLAGIYLAFSSFMLRAFSTLGADDAAAVMNAVNVTILRSPFMPLFFGSTLIAAALVITSLWHWGTAGAAYALAAGLIYLVGMFGVTAIYNVPLNNSLARSEDEAEAGLSWDEYVERWRRWNNIRTAASIATLLICIEFLAR